jgi:ketosteroid isomerase-like protein
MSAQTDLIVRYYEALTRRDIEALMTMMHPQARFEDFLEGGEIAGPGAVRAFFERLFGTLAPDFDLISVKSRPDGRVQAEMQVVTHDRSGHVWSDTRSYAIHAVIDGLIHNIELQFNA